jgi:hypothetical protein
MEFIGAGNNLVVYKDTVILNSIVYDVKKILVYNKDVIRMEFDQYEIKMFKGNLRLINKTNDSVLVLAKVNQIDQEDDEWYEYNVHKFLIVSINKTYTRIKVNDVGYDVTDIKQVGDRTSYICSEGELRIKKDKQTGDWNKIAMSLKI